MAKSLFLVASLLLLLPLSLAATDPKTVVKEAAAEKRPPVGIYQVIQNVSDPNIQDLGKFAVDEYNKNTHPHLRFVEVICGKYQVVAGTNYDLLLIAFDGQTNWVYEALINVNPKKNRTLNGFFKVETKH